MPFLYISCSQSQKMYITTKQKRNDTSSFLSTLMLQITSYYFDVMNCFPPISIWNKTVFKTDLCLTMPNNQSQYYTCYWQRHVTEYSGAAWTYQKNNRDEINARQGNFRRRIFRLQNENEYSRETLLDDIAPFIDWSTQWRMKKLWCILVSCGA